VAERYDAVLCLSGADSNLLLDRAVKSMACAFWLSRSTPTLPDSPGPASGKTHARGLQGRSSPGLTGRRSPSTASVPFRYLLHNQSRSDAFTTVSYRVRTSVRGPMPGRLRRKRIPLVLAVTRQGNRRSALESTNFRAKLIGEKKPTGPAWSARSRVLSDAELRASGSRALSSGYHFRATTTKSRISFLGNTTRAHPKWQKIVTWMVAAQVQCRIRCSENYTLNCC